MSYRFYPAGTTMTLNQFRSEQEMIVKALQQRAPPGAKITIVAIEGDDGANLAAHVQGPAPDGRAGRLAGTCA